MTKPCSYCGTERGTAAERLAVGFVDLGSGCETCGGASSSAQMVTSAAADCSVCAALTALAAETIERMGMPPGVTAKCGAHAGPLPGATGTPLEFVFTNGGQMASCLPIFRRLMAESLSSR